MSTASSQSDGKSPRHRAVCRCLELRKMNHIVTLLFALTQLPEHALVDRSWRIDTRCRSKWSVIRGLSRIGPQSSASRSKGPLPFDILS